MTTHQQPSTQSNVPQFLGPTAHQRASVQPLDDNMRKRYGFTGGPVFVTTAAMQDPHLADALDWFNGPYESVTTGESRDIGRGFTAFFGFDPDAPNARAFYVTIAKAAN
ncbi:hypothetical protein [Burkholderia contaminans]|nr:hypothetical protein [Burkholderia contaminans]